MPDFASATIIAGVLIFLGGLIALGAQKARQMGAPFAVSRSASFLAGIALLGAIGLVANSIAGFEDRHNDQSEAASDLDKVLG